MVKLNKIYTKTGDDGTTGLVRGPRRFKYDLRVDCYGTVDEANAMIGIARLSTTSMPKVDAVLARIQNDLFDLGSDLATPGADPDGTPPSLRITAEQCTWLEQMIDLYNEALAPLRSFVLPGGPPRRAAGGRAGAPGAGDQQPDHHLPQPPERPAVRAVARRQPERQERRAVGARPARARSEQNRGRLRRPA